MIEGRVGTCESVKSGEDLDNSSSLILGADLAEVGKEHCKVREINRPVVV